nr:hypothetical protein [Acinetobacter baumannii]
MRPRLTDRGRASHRYTRFPESRTAVTVRAVALGSAMADCLSAAQYGGNPFLVNLWPAAARTTA